MTAREAYLRWAYPCRDQPESGDPAPWVWNGAKDLNPVGGFFRRVIRKFWSGLSKHERLALEEVPDWLKEDAS